jgi:hypothetical protein
VPTAKAKNGTIKADVPPPNVDTTTGEETAPMPSADEVFS